MTAQIELINVEKHFGAYHALRAINLAIEPGRFVALVGPSGCGKSTLLRTIAGLETISGGELRIVGERVNDLPPRRRDIAMVFQSYALYPHMTVEDNMTYSLRVHGVGKAEARKAALEVASTIELTPLLKRYPRELSGGQRQRVAMGRAIIRHPKAFLFDEPLSNLDAALRVHMRKEIRSLHDRLNATSVYVTHDQIEAMTMADDVVLMRAGVIEQQGKPLDLYDRPANRFVAGFIGSPAMNFAPGRIGEDGKTVVLSLGAEQALPYTGPLTTGRPVLVGFRPEHLRLARADEPALTLRVKSLESTGSSTFLFTDSVPEITVVHSGRDPIRSGDSVRLAIAADELHFFDPESELRL